MNNTTIDDAYLESCELYASVTDKNVRAIALIRFYRPTSPGSTA